MSEAWTLHRRDGGTLLARLVVTGADFPWLNARVEAKDGLAEVLPLFTEELRVLDEDLDSWDSAYEAVRNAVTLRRSTGQDVPEFLLHIDGDQAWWRWSDEPFDEQNG